ncbi:MAG: CDP-diacylglycerol--serine O-phosphatidyltransferase [Nitrospinae bacterium]|nr:CDP-diacylglycerol--serine O-phosphatidyltransferase [Nitrospinota bacterium]
MKRPFGNSPKLRRGIHILPSLFTTGNVFCGFYAFIAVLNRNYYLAAWAIVIATVFDMLDGRIARLTRTTSAFGLQYDSLADVISFGMAPAFLAYSWILKPFGKMGWMAAFLFLLCGALRLARFNVTKPDMLNNHFIGLPIPAAATALASIVIVSDLLEHRVQAATMAAVMVAVVYTLAFLMVSNIKYPSFKKFELTKRVTFTRFLFVVLALYIFATIPSSIALFAVCVTYVLLGPLGVLISYFNRKLRPQSHEETPRSAGSH